MLRELRPDYLFLTLALAGLLGCGQASTDPAPADPTATPTPPPPLVAVDDSYTVAEDGILTVGSETGVIANDSGAILAAVLVAAPDVGSLSLQPDGSFTFTPEPDFNGSDAFLYQVQGENGASNVAAVILQVTGVDDAPAAVDDNFAVAENAILTAVAPGVLGNDTDVDGDELQAVLETATQNGTIVLNTDGSFEFTPDAFFNGSDSFTYRALGGPSSSGVATVQIAISSVPDAPVTNADLYVGMEDTTLDVAAPGVLVNDSDADGDTLTAELDTNAANGNVSLMADGSFSYVPNAGFTGNDTFTYRANDGTLLSGLTLVTITINPDPGGGGGGGGGGVGLQAIDDFVSTPAGVPVQINVLANDSGSGLEVVSFGQGADGMVTLDQQSNIITYVPNTGFTGDDLFFYTIWDADENADIGLVSVTVE